MDQAQLSSELSEHNKTLDQVRSQVHKVVVGQDTVIDAVLQAIICNGHVLLEGVPGIAKTLTVNTISKTIKDALFQRIQFTPDLLPTDITGVTVYEQKKGFYTIKGPIFANVVVGDEINRTPPKVQSAMLQAMQEREVTIGRKTLPLPKPFFVLATENPLETKGVYPLPEAQVDRFIFKVNVGYCDKKQEKEIIDSNIIVKDLGEYHITPVLSVKAILHMQDVLQEIYLSEEVKRYIVSLVKATRFPDEYNVKTGKYIRWGASPRASINLARAARATAFMNQKTFVTPEDVRHIVPMVLRHRILLNYEGKAREISSDQIIDEIIKKVPVM